ncbi:MAG: glycerol-3-phosphate dehydrogenase [Proteobacteria bacterium]|uniref:glycerol-3-phosphate dehydrogenase n=1 Tax=Rudaea sp. TaxID=2136325 RepID=UPI001DC59BAE|nr:glycerol-3-phosphate dehydrogenase [Pseudomonadota bacterium]MBS0566048.1 glycerol-3-phosphate dehydrogenase [Pseudomonadota bacterium]
MRTKAENRFDLLVVGGGINGAAIARDAAGRGLSVLLVEQDDLAAHTSSASSKLIHGGLRYLEQYEFSLVAKALAERDVVLNSAPHIVRPLRFVLPHEPHLRPEWMIRAGLLLYDRLGRRRAHTLLRSRRADLHEHVAGAPLKPQFATGFIYSDAWCDDARLVVLNALDAQARGAAILTRTRCTRARRGTQTWRAQLRGSGATMREIEARALVNAAGPWAASFLDKVAHLPHAHTLRLVKGSHIVVRKLYDHPYAYTFQQADRRIVFAIPFEHDYTLVGTTDIEFAGRPESVRIDADEIAYLCTAANRYFTRSIAPADVIWSYSGVRPLLEEAGVSASEVTRDYLLDFDDGRSDENRGAPLLNVFGGKITTHRRLAEDALDRLAPALGNTRGAWTADERVRLPGGEFADAQRSGEEAFARFLLATARRYPWLPDDLALRYARAYGTRIERITGASRKLDDLGECFGANLHQAEVDYLVREEWARSADDVLWRRSKLGLRFDVKQRQRLEMYLAGTLEEVSQQ